MREDAKNQVLEITKGWGIWIETVEITDVRIMSKNLFKNMQAEFRSATKLKAEKIEMETSQELSDRRREFEVESSKAHDGSRKARAEASKNGTTKRSELERVGNYWTVQPTTRTAISRVTACERYLPKGTGSCKRRRSERPNAFGIAVRE